MRDAAKEVLIKLLGNVINDPKNTKYRAIKLTNRVIEEKLLPASGAFEILFSGEITEKNRAEQLFIF